MEQLPNIYSLHLGLPELTMVTFVVVLLVLLGALLSLYHHIVRIRNGTHGGKGLRIKRHMEQFNSEQLGTLLQHKKFKKTLLSVLALLACVPAVAQETTPSGIDWSNAGIVITIILVLIPVLCGLVLMVVK